MTNIPLSREAAIDRLSEVKGIMFDIDGCLVISDGPAGQDGRALAGAAEAIELAQQHGRKYCVFTNGTAQRPAEIAHHLRELGINVPDELVLTPAIVAAEVVKARFGDAPVLVFGAPGMLLDFAERGVNMLDIESARHGAETGAKAVVIGWDTDFGKAKIQLAAEAILAGAELYCTSYARAFASKDRLNVGVSGFITEGLRFVTGVDSFEVLGKPSPHAMQIISALIDVPTERILVIGDDIRLESAMARHTGALAGLVTTGTSSAADAAECDPAIAPEIVVETMTELNALFAEADSRALAR